MRVLLVLLLLLPLQLWSADPAEDGMPVVQRYQVAEYTDSGQVWRVLQRRNGVMVFAAHTGLLGFDGERFEYLGGPGGAVYDVAEGADGRLYIGTGQALGYIAADAQRRWQWHAYTLPPDAPAYGDIGRIVEYAGQAFFLSRSHVLIESQGRWRWQGTSQSYNGLQERDGQLWLYENGAGLKQFDASRGEFVAVAASGLPDSGIAVFSRGAEPWTVSDRATLYQRIDGRWQALTLSPALAQSLSADRIESLARLPNGDLAIGTRFGGYYQLRSNGELRRRLAPDYLPGARITDIGVDAEGGIWLTIDGGIARLEPDNAITRFGREQGVSQVERVLRHQGQLYAATRQGLKRLQVSTEPGHPARFVDDRIQRNSTWALLPTAAGLLVGTGNSLMLLPDGAPAREIFRNARVSALAAGNDGWIYAVVANELWRLRAAGGDFQVDPASVRLLPMFDLAVDGDALYTSIDGGGVYRIDQLTQWPSPRVTRFGADEGIPDGRATFAWDGAGLIVMAEGVRRLGNERFALDPRFPSGLAISALTASLGGRSWAADQQQLYALSTRDDGQLVVSGTPLQRFRHPARHLYLEADGTLWLADDSGLLRMQAEPAADAPTAAPVLQQLKRIDGQIEIGSAPGSAPLTLPAQARELSLQLALPSYQREWRPRWRYRVGGGEFQDSRTAEFTLSGLQAGAQRIDIQAIAPDGRVLGALEVPLTIRQYAYETPLVRLAALLLLALLIAGSAIGYARLRTRKLQAERLRLEALVVERTQDIRRQAEEIQALSEARTRFFAHVSHEFRTPLTLILGPLTDALGGRFGALAPALAAALGTARQSSQRLLKLVSELLDLSRLAAGRFDLHVGEYDLCEQLRRELAAFATQASSRQIDLVGEGLSDPLLMWYDRDQMERMVSNLLANALKFTPAGGRVVLRLVPTASEIGIEVEDNGPGIAESEQTRIFERFYQGSSTAPPDAPGTGIGLALVRELMELHHGRVELISAPGQGACFVLWFRRGHAHFGEITRAAPPLLADSTPALVWSAQAPADASTPPSIEPLRPTVLVVDDHVELRRYLADRLGDGFRVICASDGDEALERIAEALPDVVVSDVMMPGLDGLSLARALRRNPESAGVPLILLSAKAHKRDIVDGLNAGADDYLTKPFDTPELIARIDALLDARRRLRRTLLADLASAPASIQVPTVESAQNKFEQRLNQLLDARISDPSFGVAEMAQALHVDRATLFRRVRTAHQTSPSELLRERRLTLADTLLRTQRGSVSEIAYAVGFDNLSYFSQAFRKRYGVAPSAVLGEAKQG